MSKSDVWANMTQTKKEALQKEYQQLQKWNNEQRQKRKEELKEQGKWRNSDLDANQEFFADIIQEYKARFEALQKKYGYKQ